MKALTLGGWLLAFGLASFAAGSQTTGVPKTGEAPPELSIAKWIQGAGKTPVSWASLKGKAVVLEFWAPWCGPCVGAIPHLNDLAEKFKDTPVIFLAVTNDKEDKVLKLLAKKPIRAWVGLDLNDSTFKAYGIRGIPQTVLVYPSGKVAAVTNPYYVSKEALDDVLAGREPKLEKPVTSQVEVGREPGDTKLAPLFEVLIRPVDGDEGAAANGVSENLFLSHNMNIATAVGLAYDIPQARIVTDLPIFEEKYTVVVRLPEGRGDQMKPLLRQALETTFGFVARRERREAEAYVLQAPAGQGRLKVSDPDGAMSRSGKGRFTAKGLPAADLCSLEWSLKAPVLDETGLKGTYEWDLDWDAERPESIVSAVKDQLGLELKREKRSIEFLILDKTPGPDTKK